MFICYSEKPQYIIILIKTLPAIDNKPLMYGYSTHFFWELAGINYLVSSQYSAASYFFDTTSIPVKECLMQQHEYCFKGRKNAVMDSRTEKM